MPTSLDYLVKALRSSIQEAITVFDEQGKRADVARERAGVTREKFSRFMENWQSQDKETVANRSQIIRDLHTERNQRSLEKAIDDSTQLSIRWVEAFCNIDDAVMRLYAFPECQESAAHVARIIREIRLLQVERVQEKVPQFGDSADSESETPDSGDAALGRVERKKQVMQFMENMDSYHTQVQDSYQQRGRRTEDLLQEAYLISTQLSASLLAS